MNAVLNQFSEKEAFDVCFRNAARKIDGKGIIKADDSAVGTGRKRLSHINIEPFDIGLHVFRHFQRAHVGQPRGGVFVLYFCIKGTDDKILDEKRHDADDGVALRGGVCCDVAAEKFFIDVVFHIVVDLIDNFLKRIVAKPRVDGRINHCNKIAQRPGWKVGLSFTAVYFTF